MPEIQNSIAAAIAGNDVVLFMKGTAQQPQCGFSGRVVKILQACGAEFRAFDVLTDPELREGVKIYSNWPTIPQLYVKGEFVGGSDIVAEMFAAGELKPFLRKHGVIA